jgi:soluble lytic murein transglycosylase-like protein
MYNESRCQPDAVSPTNDYGLVQVNWKTWRHMVTDLGYTREHLLNPAINLLIGRLIYQEAINAGYRCAWSPWYMSGSYC